MAQPNLVALANRLFDGFMAPLVLGGDVTPARPIGARAALALAAASPHLTLVDIDRFAHVGLARVRVARRLVPVDRVPGPSPEEWALAAALHDLVQSTHPGFDQAFRRADPRKILALVAATLERVAPPRSVGEALLRHTWFARLFELERVDTTVRFWVGSRTFLGESPPARLMAWPELRRVHVDKAGRRVMDLPKAGGAVDPASFGDVLSAFLSREPLTDLASCHRESPPFLWSSASLGLAATPVGRATVTRALSFAPKTAVDVALGRATRALIATKQYKAAFPALDLLAERALTEAMTAGPKGELAPVGPVTDDAGFARAAGALVACERLRSGDPALRDVSELLSRLAPLAETPAAQALRESLTS